MRNVIRILALVLCTIITSHAGSGGGRIGSKIKIHSGKFGTFEKKYERGQVAWEIESTRCGLENSIIQVWVREKDDHMWEAPVWTMSDCKIRIFGNERVGTPGPWKGWEYQIKVLR